VPPPLKGLMSEFDRVKHILNEISEIGPQQIDYSSGPEPEHSTRNDCTSQKVQIIQWKPGKEWGFPAVNICQSWLCIISSL
jgi:hypothetical protein